MRPVADRAQDEIRLLRYESLSVATAAVEAAAAVEAVDPKGGRSFLKKRPHCGVGLGLQAKRRKPEDGLDEVFLSTLEQVSEERGDVCVDGRSSPGEWTASEWELLWDCLLDVDEK